MGGKVSVVGSYMRDVSMTVDRFPAPGETLVGHDFLESHGGKGSNQGVQAARAGAAVAMIAAVGNDAAGEAARQMWSGEGIGTADVTRQGGAATGVAMILVDAAGRNMIAVDPSANRLLRRADIDSAQPALASAALVLAQLETPAESVARAFALASAGGAATLLNAAPARPDLPAALWDTLDFLVVNEIEARQLAGHGADADPVAAAAALAPRVRRAVVVTLGADGAVLIARSGARTVVPALAVEVIDSTGAGDAFVGAFAARWCVDGDLEAALAWGAAAGSLACTVRGVVPSLPQRAAIEAAVHRRGRAGVMRENA